MRAPLPWSLPLAALGLILAVAPARAADAPPGAALYRDQCARCHGASGEGTLQEYPHPLIGERSVGQLKRLIAKTMPADDPETLSAEDAGAVASYIYDAFYSRTAQARLKPARVELSRLTVRQYRNVMADLVGTFRGPLSWDSASGLKAEYYSGRRLGGRSRAIERVDPTVDFDFGTGSPDPENDKIDPNEFSIRWQGSVLAPETGEYEFTVRTEHAARLWVNDPNKPLIDAWVKSGNDTLYRATVHLLGGRAYPIRLEYSKAKQGVDDSKKNKNRKPPAVKSSIHLEWKLPQRVAEVIPARNLSPARNPESFVLTTRFPPDDRSTGYERGTTISKAWDQATTDAAIEIAGYVADHLRELSGAPGEGPEREKKLREFAARFVERAFRHPLSPAEKDVYVDRQFARAKSTDAAVKRVVLLALKSPRFLYRELHGGDAFDVAARVAFTLWDSLPDQALLDAAKDGKLATRDDAAREARRLLSDLRTKAKVRDFLFEWLRVEAMPDLSKDPEQFPGFDSAVANDLRTSLDLFLEDVVWGDSSDFRQLLMADFTYLNGRLAKVYGVELPERAPFTRMTLEPRERAGVLSHPYLLATFAYTSASSPIHRGVFLARSVLGRALRPPPAASAPLAPDLHPSLTTRERVALQTSPDACMACHAMINPLGFTMERFDAIGRFRKEERGRPVNATGGYQTRDGGTVTFDGTRDLAAFLAGTEESHTAFVQQLFQYAVKQPVRAFGPDALAGLRNGFVKDGFNVRNLLVEVTAASALTPKDGGR